MIPVPFKFSLMIFNPLDRVESPSSELVRWRNREETTKRTTPTERYYRPERQTPRLLVLRSEGHKCN